MSARPKREKVCWQRRHPFVVRSLHQKVLAEKYGKIVPGVDEAVLRHFYTYHWLGNVRELENIMQRSILSCRDGERKITLDIDAWLFILGINLGNRLDEVIRYPFCVVKLYASRKWSKTARGYTVSATC